MMIPAHETAARGTHASPITPRHWDSPEPPSQPLTSPPNHRKTHRIQAPEYKRNANFRAAAGWMEAARARALAAPAALLPALPLHSSLGVQGTRGVAIGAASATARAPSCAPPPRAPAATPAEGEVRVRIRTRARALGMGCTRRAAYLHPIYKPPCPGGGWRASPARANSMRLEAIRGGLTGRKRVCAGV